MAASYNRSRGGLYAKRVGAEFEHRFYHYCNGEEDTACIRIFDGCLRIGKNKLIQTAQPFDFIVSHKQKIIFCDTKSTSTTTYSLNIKKIHYQLQELGRMAGMGHPSGYLVEYRELQEYRWFSVQKIREILKTRKSLVPMDGIHLGETFPMEIDFQKIFEGA